MKAITTIFSLSLIAVIILLGFRTCNNQMARTMGGTVTVQVPKGEKVVEATWKANSIWYLTEPMDDEYEPKTKHFRETSELGIMEGHVIFVESR